VIAALTLCYVLQNARRHGDRIDVRFGGMDPFSSAWWFDGWRDDSWKRGLPPPESRTVTEPCSWLVRVGWKRSKAGLLSITETPAARRREQRARPPSPPDRGRLAHRPGA
jgi:hypothetical protein